jgi:predicted Zn-dependent protease
VRRLAAVSILGIGLIGGCAPVGGVRPFQPGEGTVALQADENRLWYESDEFDEQLANAGAVYPDEQLQVYLQQIVDRLFPEFKGTMPIHPFYSSEPNAFALPNGSIYFDIGLLARLDNEAQLAAIIGHEGSHFVGRHSLRSLRSAKQSMNAVIVFQTLTGIPVVGEVVAYSSMMGYSRALEREADAGGFQRMRAAGYEVTEAKKPFQRLAREAEVMDYRTPVFFSSHPQMAGRVSSFEEMEVGVPATGRINEDAFRARAEPAIQASLVTDLERREPKVVIFLLEDEGLLGRSPPEYRYYLAEAYRFRGEPGDAERAEDEYQATLDCCPGFAPPHEALGIIRMKQGRNEEACDHFTRYLELAPEAQDRAYIERYLARLKEESQ